MNGPDAPNLFCCKTFSHNDTASLCLFCPYSLTFFTTKPVYGVDDSLLQNQFPFSQNCSQTQRFTSRQNCYGVFFAMIWPLLSPQYIPPRRVPPCWCLVWILSLQFKSYGFESVTWLIQKMKESSFTVIFIK